MINKGDAERLSLSQTRIVTVIGACCMLIFILADLPLIPDSLHTSYLVSRLGIQFPILLVFFALTFTSIFARIHQLALWITAIGITFANYWFTFIAWQQENINFPYEGVLLYALFSTFVLRMNFKYTGLYVTLSILAFAAMVITFPIYGELTYINLGFVTFGLLGALLGVKQIEANFVKLNIANSKLKILSELDSLTGIFNRRTFEEEFNKSLNIAKRTDLRVSVYILDLDYFKDFNDGYGHQLGDDIIKKQAIFLQEIFSRETDLIARYGGEEFIVVCLADDKESAQAQGEKLIKRWKHEAIPHGKGQGSDIVTCSVGLYSIVADASTTAYAMIERADNALYKAKSQGRATLVVDAN